MWPFSILSSSFSGGFLLCAFPIPRLLFLWPFLRRKALTKQLQLCFSIALSPEFYQHNFSALLFGGQESGGEWVICKLCLQNYPIPLLITIGPVFKTNFTVMC